MSGHSKWSSIKHKKGAADAKRGKLFSKLSRAIIVAAKDGGPDPAGNLALAERDREGPVLLHAEGQHRPRDRPRRRARTPTPQRSRRSSTRATAPNGVAVLVEALTDNRNRTAADVRHVFAKNDGNLGTSGRGRVACSSGAGVILVAPTGVDEDELTLAAAEGGAEDVDLDGSTLPDHLRAGGSPRGARGGRGSGLHGRLAELTMVPKTRSRSPTRPRRRRSCA